MDVSKPLEPFYLDPITEGSREGIAIALSTVSLPESESSSCACRLIVHERILLRAETQALAEDVMISVSDPLPENLRSLEIRGELSFGPPVTGESTTRVVARAYYKD